jgi:hypothetical protein
MSVYKIKQETYIIGEKNDQSFKRNIRPYREGFVNYDFEAKKITMNKSPAKWKAYTSTHDKTYIEMKKELMSGLVFKTKEAAEKFMKENKNELEILGNEHPTHKFFKVIRVIERFQNPTTLKFWEDKK